MMRNTRVAAAAAVALAIASGWTVPAQSPAPGILDESVPSGANFDKAEFRYWAPADAKRIDAVLVLVPGSNSDGRSMAEDAFWQQFASSHRLAIVACRLTDKPHDQGFIEEYVDVSKGSGQALLTALSAFATRGGHAEVATAPLIFWGMSAGGEFNYEFAAWKPERVIAFVVNKGNIYYTALVSRDTRRVPALLFVGEKDLEFRTNTITGLFAVNRRGGALWALTMEPGVAHAVGRSRDLGAMFFEDVLPLRLPADGAVGTGLRPIDEASGYVGDLKTMTYQPAAGMKAPGAPTAWLPTERLARAWQAVVSGKPFEL
jgi:poly(3-hydroxybutyrate) depolymerase